MVSERKRERQLTCLAIVTKQDAQKKYNFGQSLVVQTARFNEVYGRGDDAKAKAVAKRVNTLQKQISYYETRLFELEDIREALVNENGVNADYRKAEKKLQKIMRELTKDVHKRSFGSFTRYISKHTDTIMAKLGVYKSMHENPVLTNDDKEVFDQLVAGYERGVNSNYILRQQGAGIESTIAEIESAEIGIPKF